MKTRVAIVVARWQEADNGPQSQEDRRVAEAVNTLVGSTDQVAVKSCRFDDEGKAHSLANGVELAIVDRLKALGEEAAAS